MTITDQGHFDDIFIEERNSVATDSCDPLRLATCNPARHDGRQFWRATVPCRRPFRSESANVAAGSLSWVAVSSVPNRSAIMVYGFGSNDAAARTNLDGCRVPVT